MGEEDHPTPPPPLPGKEKLPNAYELRPEGEAQTSTKNRDEPDSKPLPFHPVQRQGEVSLCVTTCSKHARACACPGRQRLLLREGAPHLAAFLPLHSETIFVLLLLLPAWHLLALDQPAALLMSCSVSLRVLLTVGVQGLSRLTCLAQPHGLNPCQEKWKNLVQPGLEKTARTVSD